MPSVEKAAFKDPMHRVYGSQSAESPVAPMAAGPFNGMAFELLISRNRRRYGSNARLEEPSRERRYPKPL